VDCDCDDDDDDDDDDGDDESFYVVCVMCQADMANDVIAGLTVGVTMIASAMA